MGQHSEQYIQEVQAKYEDKIVGDEMRNQTYEQWEQEDKAQEERMKEQDTKPISVINLFSTGLTKTDIKVLSDNSIQDVLESGNVLQVAEALSAMELFIKEVKDDPRFKDYVREETAKTPKGYISKSGAKIELCEVGSKYDFSLCNDQALADYESGLKTLEDLTKERKEFLKKLPAAGIIVTNEETGETSKVYPPSKSSTSSYKITLAK